MPARSRFVDAPHYYSTLFHELVHNAETRIMPRRILSLVASGAFQRGYSA
jgi:antirestriction protein ArdC